MLFQPFFFVCILFSCQICDSVGLAKQIALHSEMVSLFVYGAEESCMSQYASNRVYHMNLLYFFVGSQSQSEAEGAGKSQGKAARRAD